MLRKLPNLVLGLGEDAAAKKPRPYCLSKPGKDRYRGGRSPANNTAEDPSLRSHRVSEYARPKTLSRIPVQSSMDFFLPQ